MSRRGLDNPLRAKPPRVSRWRINVAPFVIAAAFLVGSVAAVWIAIVDDPDGGTPVATARIDDAPLVTGSLARPVAPAASATPASSFAGPPGQTIDVNAPLLEASPFGMLPRVAPDGRLPRDVYSRRAAGAESGQPQVALVVGGLGISQTGTQKALEILPNDVTLAFAAYGSSLQRWASRARSEGREILLQVPLEPEGYPEQNPGEHTLTVAAQGIGDPQDLDWNLGRATSYAGVMNYMGGRFMGDDKATAALLGELGARGLYFLDDGTSPGSRAADIGATLQVPVVVADLVLDRDRSSAALKDQLTALEALARSKGAAVGVATAFPSTVDAIAAWARDAAGRGISIVPASAILARQTLVAR